MLERAEYIKHLALSLPHIITDKEREAVAEFVVDVYMRDIKATIELCANIADHQAEICGRSMSRQSTSHDIAINIRKLLT